MAVDKKNIVNLQGKDHVLFVGLLNEAHDQGLESIETDLVKLELDGPTPVLAIVKATVRMKDGRSATGYGDANKGNVNTRIATALVRMAETRAIGRALRFLTNIGMTMLEELPEDEPVPHRQERSVPRERPQQGRPAEGYRPVEEVAEEIETATDAARRAYFKAERDTGLTALIEEIDSGSGYAKALARAVFCDLAEREMASRAEATAADLANARRRLEAMKPETRRALVQGYYEHLTAPAIPGMSPDKDAALKAQSPNRAAQLAGH